MGIDDEDLQANGVQAPIRSNGHGGVNPLFNLELLFRLANYVKSRTAPRRGWTTIRMFGEGDYIEARDFLMKLPKAETATKKRSLFIASDQCGGNIIFFCEKKKEEE